VFSMSMHSPSQITLSDTEKLAVGCAKANKFKQSTRTKKAYFIGLTTFDWVRS